MQKILYFIILWGCLFQYSNAQTVEITAMDLKSTSGGPEVSYSDSKIDIGESSEIVRIFFDFDEIDTDTYHNILFLLNIDYGSGNSTLVSMGYQSADAIALFDALHRNISLGTSTITIQVTGLDDDNMLQVIAESEPWTITYSFNQILGNKICCDQNTLSYPFDPSIINQDASFNITTQDGAMITSIQWQKLNSSLLWVDIPGANQMSYDPPSVNIDSKYRRVLTSSSGTISNSPYISITKVVEIIRGNAICCSQTTGVMPFDPNILQQSNNTTVTSDFGSTFTYQWQQTNALGNFVNIQGATNSSYDPPFIKNQALFQRIAISSNGTTNISNPVGILLQPCTRPQDEQNLICGNQTFYKVQHGDTINPGLILGDYDTPDIIRREFGYDFMVSTDGQNWSLGKPKKLLSISDDSPYGICLTTYTYVPPSQSIPNLHSIWDTFVQLKSIKPGGEASIINHIYNYNPNNENSCVIVRRLLDFQPQSFIFDISKGNIQHLYIRKDYYEWYDPFNCSILNRPPLSCGAQWYLKKSSNIATITLTTGDFPKPVPPITSSRNNVTCNWSDQTLSFSVPQLNNGEYYKWTIPSTWTLNNQSLEGYYVNNISVQTNSGDGNYAKGGQVCLEVTQGGQTDRQCITIAGSSPTNIVLPATIQGCEGQTVVIKPILTQNNAIANPANYNFSWQAYQSQNISCGTLNDCKELSLIVSNVRQNPTQAISVTVKDNLGCKTSANTVLVTAPGLQMGILNSYSDPKAISNSGLAINTVNNYLYFTGQNKNIYRSYYDNTPGQLIWKYVPLKDKNTNQAITSDGPVAYYKGVIDKLFYVRGSYLYYAESSDNGLTWVDKFSSGHIAQNIDARIKIYGTNIYYIENNTRQVSYKNVTITNPSAVLVGSDQVNYSQRMFTVEDNILSYADVNNNIVAFDANTGMRFTINAPPQFKQVNYNSSISTYNNNIYYTSSSGTLRILKRNTSTVIYDNYEEVSNPVSPLQLAGPFAINKQTGTVYAKAYDVLGKQIYYLNGKWNFVPINSPLSYSAIQSDMTYTNEHAYYIGDNGYLSNTYYIAPCIPAVLRTSNAFDGAGDVMNDPLSNEITEDHSVLFYPNPTTGIVKATFNIANESIIQIKIIPVTGGSTDVIYNASTQAGTQEIPFDLSTYAAGIYIVQVYVDGTLYTKSKLIKY